MLKAKIKMYLIYWLNNPESEEEVNEFLKQLNLYDVKYEKVKCGDNGIKFSEICLETPCLDDVTEEFLSLFGNKTDEINIIADKYEGSFILEIVPEMYNMEKPQLGFDNEFLKFIQKLKNFKHIDIDQYFY